MFFLLRYKNAFFSNSPNGRILPFGILSLLIPTYRTALTDRVANFVELGHAETWSGRNSQTFFLFELRRWPVERNHGSVVGLQRWVSATSLPPTFKPPVVYLQLSTFTFQSYVGVSKLPKTTQSHCLWLQFIFVSNTTCHLWFTLPGLLCKWCIIIAKRAGVENLFLICSPAEGKGF